MSVWADEDVDFEQQLENWGTEIELPRAKPNRIFNAWIESWESEIVKNAHPTSGARFLIKYGNMVWTDPDNNNKLFTADAHNMIFQAGRSGCGWCVKGVREDGEEEPWMLSLLVEMIAKTEQLANLKVTIVQAAGLKDHTK